MIVGERSLIPICYTQVSVTPGREPGILQIRRDGELHVNRHYLMESGDLTDPDLVTAERTFSLRQAESAFCAMLMVGVNRASLREEVARMKITIEIDAWTLLLVVIDILVYSAIG